jgi:hypothetical protein
MLYIGNINYSPLTFEKSKSFRSIDGDGRIFSGPFDNCWLWLLPLIPLLFMLSLWRFDFSLESGEGEIFELKFAFEFEEFSSSALVWSSVFKLQWTDVFEFGRECGASAMGLRWFSLCRSVFGEPGSSFFGDLGRVNANACVWNKKKWPH